MNIRDTTHEDVRRYYGEVLESSRDLKTSACCPAEAMPPVLRRLLDDVHPEVKDRFYGCGSPLPPALEGCTVLDRGCGSGRDVYLLSRLVGPHGRVIGVAAFGCADTRTVAQSPNALLDPEIDAKIGMVGFRSLTVRAFKLELEDRCEDHGQVATYLGGVDGSDGPAHAFVLDDHHRFETGRPMLVCGNTAAMLAATRYAPYFRIDGDKSAHYGLFDCGPTPASVSAGAAACC